MSIVKWLTRATAVAGQRKPVRSRSGDGGGSDVVGVGDIITVEIISLDLERGRIGLQLL